MIYAPDPAVDRQLMTRSQELVREAMALLRSSDHIVSGQRLRDELEQERRKPPRRDRQHPDKTAASEDRSRQRSEQMREGDPDGHRQAQDNCGVR
ncbi:hypothetical protein [Bradyrhizobium zhanjiangense]|uniref:Uncharacterized protein n=1 Tax=Bradyrhizobium zhanjiangense TaxID=1325107 RepID=A0ABY0DF38_9BRAD|nr:hypothetical protein [Bradyrhizobium zhanjiangense]RXG91131.1 hypothetical protein EAS62_25820 [Bradyrhizobium zhanjiangense]